MGETARNSATYHHGQGLNFGRTPTASFNPIYKPRTPWASAGAVIGGRYTGSPIVVVAGIWVHQTEAADLGVPCIGDTMFRACPGLGLQGQGFTGSHHEVWVHFKVMCEPSSYCTAPYALVWPKYPFPGKTV